MNYKTLGHTGLKVSELCLGTMTFGDNFFKIAVVDQASANKMVARALEAGINLFDTADVYAYGQSETLLGRAIKDSGVERDAVIIATVDLLEQGFAQDRHEWFRLDFSRC